MGLEICVTCSTYGWLRDTYRSMGARSAAESLDSRILSRSCAAPSRHRGLSGGRRRSCASAVRGSSAAGRVDRMTDRREDITTT
eukprot:446220-Prymnesium_polylepis.1